MSAFRSSALTLACLLFSLSALAGNSATIPNNVPPWLTQATLVGSSDTNGKIAIAVHLQPTNVAGLQTFLHDLYTPGTASYGHFLTPHQFRAAYSPSAASVAAVQGFLSQHGLQLTYTPANGMYVEAIGTVGQIKQVLSVTQNQYKYKGNVLRSNAEAPTIPAALAPIVTFIEGLDDSNLLIQPTIKLRAGSSSPSAPPPTAFPNYIPPCSTYWGDHTATVSPAAYQYGAALPWANCGYTPQQMQAAYGANRVPWTGTGVRIGIVDAFASPTIVADVNQFSANHGLPPLTSNNFEQIVVPGTLNYPENRQNATGWYEEESLDVEWVHAIAPGATIVFVSAQDSGALNNGQDVNGTQTPPHALIHLIDNHLADIITNSWGDAVDLQQYGLVQALESALMQAATEGISVLFASGDWGDDLAYHVVPLAQASWPATSPFATAVGGTTLAIYDAAGNKGEWGWGTSISTLGNSPVSLDGTQVTGTSWSPWPPAPFAIFGSTGGVSLKFLQPDYQQGIVPTILATSTVDSNGNTITLSSPHRVVPDISMDADAYTSGVLIGETLTISGDPLADLACTPLTPSTEYCEYPGGGTSLASPMFAGVLALANQARFAAGKGPVGFVNPAIYRMQVGPLGSGAPIEDIVPPARPLAALFNAETSPGVLDGVPLFTINSEPLGASGPLIQGWDSSLRTTPGYDNVTGLGVPNVPPFIEAFTSLP